MKLLGTYRQRCLLIALMLGAAGVAQGADVQAADVTLKVGRFFGPCTEAGTNIDQVKGEACIIQAILNAFTAENNSVKINMQPASWDRYYQQLLASYANSMPPDVHILHRHRIPEFTDVGALAPLGEDLAAAGIDITDWEPNARAAVTVDDTIFGVPFDMHANLWHINLAILAKANLVGSDGSPILPESPGELLDHAKRVKDATGKDYLASDFVQFPIGVRAVLSLLWQQGKNIFDGNKVTIDTPEMRAAITTITDLFDAGYANPRHNYERAQQAFLDGHVAVLINGTWAVEFYDQEVSKAEIALADYDVADFPTLFDNPATWADTHLWVIPADLKAKDPNKYQAALKLLAWINDHNLDWARTGHLAIRTSVLESETYRSLPHRLDYINTGGMTRDIPDSISYNGIQDILTRNLQDVWGGKKSLDDALADTEIEADVQARLPKSASR